MEWKGLGCGLFLGIIGGALLVRAGAPPALAGVALVGVAGWVGLNLLESALWPKRVSDIERQVEGFPLRSFLVGILAILVWIFAAGMVENTFVAPVVYVILMFVVGAALLGGPPAAVATTVGRRLVPDGSATWQITAGTLVLATAVMLPVLGWILVLSVAVTGLGAGVLSVATHG